MHSSVHNLMQQSHYTHSLVCIFYIPTFPLLLQSELLTVDLWYCVNEYYNCMCTYSHANSFYQ